MPCACIVATMLASWTCLPPTAIRAINARSRAVTGRTVLRDLEATLERLNLRDERRGRNRTPECVWPREDCEELAQDLSTDPERHTCGGASPECSQGGGVERSLRDTGVDEDVRVDEDGVSGPSRHTYPRAVATGPQARRRRRSPESPAGVAP